MTRLIGIDLGGTKIAAAAYDTEREAVVGRAVVATEGQHGADHVILRMIALARDTAQSAGWDLASVEAVGVGVPAVVDYVQGNTVMLPNIPGNWTHKPVAGPMQQALDLPVYLINDARAFTLAEASRGAGRGYPIVACFTLGTGIGGGIAVNGQLLLGADGGAGEFGHICIDYNGLPDGSGTPGGLESYGSGPAIAAHGVKVLMQGINTRLGEFAGHSLDDVTPAVVAAAADAGDPVAQQILEYAGRMIGVGMANVLTIVNPHAIVIGGGMSQLGDRIMAPIRAALPIFNRTANLDRLALLLAELGADAGAIGAALWADQQQRQPSAPDTSWKEGAN